MSVALPGNARANASPYKMHVQFAARRVTVNAAAVEMRVLKRAFR